MPVSVQLVMKLQKLRRMTHAEAAERLHLPIADIEGSGAHGRDVMRDDDVEPPRPTATDEEREAMIDRMPKKMQERIRRSRS